MKMRSIRICLTISVLMFFLLSSIGCKGQIIEQEMRATYPIALKWNDNLYNPSLNNPIEDGSIGERIGEITGQKEPMPQNNGEINSTVEFKPGNRLYSIKGVETSEAIAVDKEGKFYRINRARSSLGVIWDNKIYDFVGNFQNENEAQNINQEIGEVKRQGIKAEEAENGDITVLGEEADASLFPQGSKIFALKNTPLNKAIAVKGTDGKYHRVEYIKKLKQ
ncbi:MAG: hypothetical protein N2484_09180 [Clostridia bacterium]|nr:hypothetical protein [Clostridia bacterium]